MKARNSSHVNIVNPEQDNYRHIGRMVKMSDILEGIICAISRGKLHFSITKQAKLPSDHSQMKRINTGAAEGVPAVRKN
jgi:hypothetical protein